jgi:hypothetical protein
MKVFTAILVASATLWAIDASLNDGRYTEVALTALTSCVRSLGFRV